MAGNIFKKSFSELLPRKLFCTTRKASDFELPGTPTTKIGILVRIDTTIITTFSLNESFHAMPCSVLMLVENTLNVSYTIRKNSCVLNPRLVSSLALDELELDELKLDELELGEAELELAELELDELELDELELELDEL